MVLQSTLPHAKHNPSCQCGFVKKLRRQAIFVHAKTGAWAKKSLVSPIVFKSKERTRVTMGKSCHDPSQREAVVRRQISCYAADSFGVHACGAADHVEVVFVGEVEQEDVVRLPVDRVLDRVGLVRDERGEYAKVPHASHDVVPVCFAQVQVGFLGEKENRLQFPVLQTESTSLPKTYSTTIWRSMLPVFFRLTIIAPPWSLALSMLSSKQSGFGFVVREET